LLLAVVRPDLPGKFRQLTDCDDPKGNGELVHGFLFSVIVSNARRDAKNNAMRMGINVSVTVASWCRI
jgi:hypothetical protein